MSVRSLNPVHNTDLFFVQLTQFPKKLSLLSSHPHRDFDADVHDMIPALRRSDPFVVKHDCPVALGARSDTDGHLIIVKSFDEDGTAEERLGQRNVHLGMNVEAVTTKVRGLLDLEVRVDELMMAHRELEVFFVQRNL